MRIECFWVKILCDGHGMLVKLSYMQTELVKFVFKWAGVHEYSGANFLFFLIEFCHQGKQQIVTEVV